MADKSSESGAATRYPNSGGRFGRGRSGASAKEWRLFMSPKVSDILREPSRGIVSGKEEDEEGDFRRILKDVEQLGTSQMSWKEKKDWEAQKLFAACGKGPKSHKMPIEMGQSIKRKRQKLEEEQLLASGMEPGKKRDGKKKARFEDRGLRASEGKFKGGVLYVKPAEKREGEEVLRGCKSHDRFFDGEGKRSSAGKFKKKGKGKGKKNKGKRR